MTTTRLLLALAIATTACKGKDKPKDPPAATAPSGSAPATPPTATPAAAPTIPLQEGESLEPGADLTLSGSNPLVWKPTATDTVAIGFVFKDEVARAVAAMPGVATAVELGTAEFNAAYSGEFGATTTSDGKAVLVLSSTGGSGDPGFTAAWRVAWDAAKKQPVVEEKGDWPGDELDKVPAWAKLPEAPE